MLVTYASTTTRQDLPVSGESPAHLLARLAEKMALRVWVSSRALRKDPTSFYVSVLWLEEMAVDLVEDAVLDGARMNSL
jgi:hypothetical protein